MNGPTAARAAQAAAVSGLRPGFRGILRVPSHEDDDRPWLPWRRNVLPEPDVVADARDPGDVAHAVAFSREHGLDLAVQCGGHGAVRAQTGGLLLRTGGLSHVEVDPGARTARVGGGALWGDVVAAASRYGLAPVSGTSPSVGVAGYTLGGGLGWLTRMHGFAADNLLRAQVVTADARLLSAARGSHEDLLWALRGGGGNFGVVTELELRLHPVDRVRGGVVFFPAERAHAVLDAYRNAASREPEDAVTAVVLLCLPDVRGIPDPLRGRAVVALRVGVLSEREEARRHIDRLLAAGGPPLMGRIGPMRFGDLTSLSDPQPSAQVSEEHTDLFRTLPDEVVGELIAACFRPDSPVSVVEIRNWTGAPGRPPADAGPAGHRDAVFSVIAIAPELDPDTWEPARVRMERLVSRLAPHATGSVFLNFLSDPGRVETAYTPADLERLRGLKRRYDPGNMFRFNHNIRP